MDLMEEFKQIVKRAAGIAPEAIRPETEYRVDLGLDSVDLAEVLIEVERSFDIEISDAEMEPIKRVDQFLEIIKEKRAALVEMN